MPNVRAFRAGNWSDTNTTTSPWATGGVLYAPNSSDDVFTNGFTVTVDNSPTVVSVTNASATSRAWKDGATTTASSGGGLILSNGQTLTATTGALTTVGANFITLSGINSAAFVGNVTANPAYSYSIVNTGSGTLTFTGYTESAGVGGAIFRNQVAGNLVINGGITSSAFSNGVYQDAGGNFIVNGYATSNGSVVIFNNGVGTVTVVGTMTASNGGGNAIRSTSMASLVKASGSFICAADGTMAVAAIKMILNTTPIAAKTRYALNGSGTFVDMFTADNTGLAPAVGDVRAGVVYGSATGALAVPPANSVAFGVPVDAGFGTAVLTPAAVWEYATRSLTTSSGATAAEIRAEMDANSTKLANLDATVSSRLAPSGTLAVVTTLTNAPSVPSAAAIASQVRTELSVELARVDAAITTRATPANIPAADIAAIKAKTDLLNTDRLANVATTNIVGTLLAQANS